jgi:hypothetical protein
MSSASINQSPWNYKRCLSLVSEAMHRAFVTIFSVGILLLSGCTGSGDGELGVAHSTTEVFVTVDAAPVEVTLDTGGIEGTVVDEEHLPIAGATIALVGRTNTTTSDGAGRFTFSHLEPGEYRITIKRSGFATAGRSVPVNAGEVSQLTVTLRTIHFDVPYHATHPWSGMVLAGYFVLNLGDGVGQPPGSSSCSACIVPCGSCFTNFNATRGLQVLIFELDAQPSVSSPVQPNDYFWQLLGASRGYARYNADYWIDRGQRHLEGGWPQDGEDFRFTNQCGLYWLCVNQRFTVHFTQFYFQGPPANFTALPPE